MLKFFIGGDFFPGGKILNNTHLCSLELMDIMKDADCRIVTLESAIGDNLPFDEEKMSNPDWRNIIYSPNESINNLLKLNINLVSLANNHIFDLGEDGLKNAITQLRNVNIAYCGAGLNQEEASKPAVLEIKGRSIAFFAYMVYFKGWRAPHPATLNKPGLNIFDIDRAVEDIKNAKSKYDYVFVLPHWGDEYSCWPTPKDVDIAKRLIKAGADGIFGSHAHQIQPAITIKSRPVYLNLGNFIFPDFYMNTDRTTYYPSVEDEIDAIPITYSYERFPKTKLLRVWPRENRRGMVAMVDILGNGSIETRNLIVELDDNCVLKISNPKEVQHKLWKPTVALKYLPYEVVFRYSRFLNPRNIYKRFIKNR